MRSHVDALDGVTPPTDAVPGLEHGDGESAPSELVGDGESSQTSSDDDHPARHRGISITRCVTMSDVSGRAGVVWKVARDRQLRNVPTAATVTRVAARARAVDDFLETVTGHPGCLATACRIARDLVPD